jgi:hypothetical protein
VAVVLAAALVPGSMRDKAWCRHRVALPLSAAIGVAGICWAVARVLV